MATIVSMIFKQVLFVIEKEKIVTLALVAAGFFLAVLAVWQNWFTAPSVALHAFYLLLLMLLPFMLFRATILATLAWFDILFTHFPQLRVESPASLEACRARVLRLFVEKNIPTYSLGAANFFTLGFEKNVLGLVSKHFGVVFPYVLFSKSPLVIVRFSQFKAVPQPDRITPQTRIVIAFEDEMRARTLARSLESAVKYL